MFNRPPSSQDHANRTGAIPGGLIEALVFWGSLAYFCGKALFFALRIKARVFPDESSWFGIVRVFSRTAWLPVDSPESYPLGLVTHIPSLYFFLMGKALAWNVLPVDDLIFARVVNVALALLTVTFAWRLARILGLSLAVRAIFMVMLTNTVMFTFVSASVNNDNLAALLAVLALYYLVRFFQDRSLCHGLLFCLFLLAGTLTKIVFLPYAVALVLVALAHERGRLAALPKALSSRLASCGWRETVLAGLCLAGLGANLLLYGGNQLRYGTWIPNMDKVLPVEKCLQNRLFSRNYAVQEYKRGKLTLLDAQRLALRIRDPGDRSSAWSQLAEVDRKKGAGRQPLMGRWSYALTWVEVIVARTYSVAAHLSLFKYEGDFYPYYAVFALAGCLWACRFRPLMVPGMAGVVFVALFYTIFLMQGVGYTTYRGEGYTGVAMTGRYMFPALVAVYLATAHALLAKMPRWWQVGIGLAVGGLFVAGEFPWFVRQAGPEWYF